MARTSERGGPATRARIAEVASRLFVERGFDAVSVAEVAREAGVSSVTVFNHFPRKEDLFLDRQEDAAELLRRAVRGRAAEVDVLASLREACLRLAEQRSPLSGLDARSSPFFRTIAGSAALTARARAIAAELQQVLADELDRDELDRDEPDRDGAGAGGGLLAALVVAGYGAVLVVTVRRLLAGDPVGTVADDHRARVEQLFAVLRDGVRAA